METLTVAWTIAKVVLGISFVIFWHELGHFLLAKWNGVHVKTFSIGFPPTFVRLFRLKETDYVLGSIPLGGYVSMLGEDEPPARPDSGEGATPGPDPAVAENPAAFMNKSVWARMAIISAGVLMNLLLGVILFTVVYLMGGMPETPTIVGKVAAAGPAYRAGMQAGDHIVRIDDVEDPTFDDLFRAVSHTVNDQVVRFVVRRPGVDEEVVIPIEPEPDPIGELPTIRIASAPAMELEPSLPYLEPAGLDPDHRWVNRFEGGDRVLRVGPIGGESTPVGDGFALDRVLDRHRDEPLEFIVARRPRSSSGVPVGDSEAREVSVTVPVNRFVDFGFRPAPGPIAAVRPDGPAARSGIGPGDVVVAVDGDDEYDPMRLPELAFTRGESGSAMVLGVRKAGGDEVVEVEVVPDGGRPWSGPTWDDEPLDVGALGLAMLVLPEVAGVRPGSAADRAGLRPGDRLESMSFVRPAVGDDSPSESTFRFGPKAGWPAAFDLAQLYKLEKVRFRVAGRPEPVAVQPEPVADWHDPRRGLVLGKLERPMEPLGLAESVRRGANETGSAIRSFYVLLQSLAQRRVGTKNLAGPIRIVSIAYAFAGRNLVEFLHFIGFISVNLAVVNFLPIPPLDGGKMVFLVGEAVRGRPLPESWQALPTYVGVVFLLLLMGFVMIQDSWLTFF